MVAFDAAFFLYLNPALALDGVHLECAEEYYATHSDSSLYGDSALVPRSFNERVYIEDHRTVADVSPLNRLIVEASCGCDDQESFVNNINLEAKLVAKNTLRLCREVSELQLGERDEIKISRATSVKSTSYARVVHVDPDDRRTIKLSNAFFDFEDRDTRYFVHGIRVADVQRVAVINYVASAVRKDECCRLDFPRVDCDFNAELYKVMYPDARALTSMGAYMDYVSRKQRGDARIHRAKDIVSTLGLDISEPVTFRGRRISKISTDATTHGSDVCGDESLITEKAIKCYVDSSMKRIDRDAVFEATATVEFETPDVVFSQGFETLAIGIGVRPRRTASVVRCPLPCGQEEKRWDEFVDEIETRYVPLVSEPTQRVPDVPRRQHNRDKLGAIERMFPHIETSRERPTVDFLIDVIAELLVDTQQKREAQEREREMDRSCRQKI